MSGWEQDDILDDDFVEGVDDEEMELDVEHGVPPLQDDRPADEPQVPVVRRRALPQGQPRPRAAHPPGPGPKFRIRAMSPRMAARSRGVTSILITRHDGSQVLLVRKER